MSNKEQTVETPKLKPLNFSYNVTLGCDPEFFFSSRGEVIGSEKILPQTGLKYDPNKDKTGNDGAHTTLPGSESHIIIDGVQAELNPRPNTCRANLGNEIGACFRKLYKDLQASGKSVDVDFTPLVKITQKELDSLSEKSKTFGCAPSTNVYKKADEAQIKVDPKKYLKRSAGGHIHLGWHAGYWGGGKDTPKMKDVLSNADVLVPILDLVVANTCVLVDRNPGNKERRVNYGRVGEFRLKEYGMEYRTLSNFWLRSYQLMSLVTGLCRMACQMIEQSTKESDYVKALTDAVPREDVIKAVQDNDFDLAMRNFRKIQPILEAAVDDGGYNHNNYPISKQYMKEWYYFVKMGMDHWFTFDTLQHWVKLPEGHGTGWENFLSTTVNSQMKSVKDVVFDLNNITAPEGPAPKLAEVAVEPIRRKMNGQRRIKQNI